MLSQIRPFRAAVAAAVLAGCGVGEALQDLTTLNEIVDRTDTVAMSPDTTVAQMPPSATAQFTGNTLGVMTHQFSGAQAYYWGDAELDVNFAAKTVEGSLSNLRGLNTRSELGDASGEIILSNGTISGADLAIDYAGDITLTNETLSVGGRAEGEFHGSNAEGLLVGDTAQGAINGTSFVSEFYIVAEQ
ncbi:MAG: transferrin-binding protein-like solute binding protein [Maritimibacter sp.]